MQPEELPMPTIDRERCGAGGLCIERCPTGALGWEQGKAALVNPEACIWCSACEQICPNNAIGLPYLIRFAPPDRAGSGE